MKLKSIILSVAVLAALSLGVWYLQRPAVERAEDPRVGQPLAVASVLGSAAQFRLTDQGKTVTLKKNPDGSWTDTSYHDLPADFPKLVRFIDDLSTAKLERLVTTSPARIARLEFKDAQVAFLDGAGKELWAVTFGKNADTGGGRFVRFGTEPKAFLASFQGWLDNDAKNWANSELLNLKADDISRIVIPFDAGGPITVTRAKKDAPWTAVPTPAGEKLNPEKITSLLPTLTNIRFTDVNAPGEPDVVEAKAHARTFELSTFDGKTYQVALGRKPGEKRPKPPAPKPAVTAKVAADTKEAPTVAAPASEAEKKEGEGAAPAPEPEKTGEAAAVPAKPAEPPAPEFDVIPPGGVFVTVTSSDATAPVNALMAKNGFRMPDYALTSLPQKPEELFEPAPPPAPAANVAPATAAPMPAPAAKTEEPKKP